MNRKYILTGVATLGVIAMAGPAFAAGPPYTVKVGSNTSGTYSVSAARTAGTTLTVKAANTSLNCTNITGNGQVTAGTGLTQIATLSNIQFVGCTINGTSASVTPNTTWNLSGTGSNATTGNETIAGKVNNVNATVLAGTASAPVCKFDVTGFATGSFNEATQELLINEVPSNTLSGPGNLTVSNKTGCGTFINNGNKATVVATLKVTSASGAINLS